MRKCQLSRYLESKKSQLGKDGSVPGGGEASAKALRQEGVRCS